MSGMPPAAPTHPTFTCHDFLELEEPLIEEFLTCYVEAREEIEGCLARLSSHYDDKDIHQMFRAMHSLKGNCRMVYLDPFVDILHSLEEIVSELREHRYPYTPSIGDFLSLAAEETELMIRQLVQHRQGDEQQRVHLYDLISKVRNTDDSHRESGYREAVAILQGDEPAAELEDSLADLTLPDDLTLMGMLAEKLDGLSIFRQGRATQQLQLSQLLNEALCCPVSPDQLRAAVMMHDIGMALIPHSIFNKEGSLSRDELRLIQQHINTGYLMLRRFGGWEEAASIVLDHHERYDGQGYPSHKKRDDIHLGARMLAIVDTYCSITNERSDRNFKKSLLSAITEINSNTGTQFDPELVEVFNEVIRTQLIKK